MTSKRRQTIEQGKRGVWPCHYCGAEYDGILRACNKAACQEQLQQWADSQAGMFRSWYAGVAGGRNVLTRSQKADCRGLLAQHQLTRQRVRSLVSPEEVK